MVKAEVIFVNAQKCLRRMRGVAMGCVLAGLLTGCGTFSDYPLGMESVVKGPLRMGNPAGLDAAERTLRDRAEEGGRDGVLFALEAGRVAQLRGDFAGSRESFAKAAEQSRAQDEAAVISAGGAADQVAAVLVNDKAIEYRAPSCERALLHHYQALNYLATNDLAGAAVEVRLANRVQEEARKAHESAEAKADEKARREQEKKGGEETAKLYAGLNELAGDVKGGWQNAATFFVSGLIWEMQGQRNDAYIDYKKALEIVPGNPYLQADVTRLGKRLGMWEDVADFARRFPQAAGTPADGSAELKGLARLVVVVEEQFVPAKTAFSLPYPVSGSIGAISIPMYDAVPPPAQAMAVVVDGRVMGKTAPLCDVSALAVRALLEKMPGILTRQVARAVAKGVATSAASSAAESSGGDTAEALTDLGMALFNLLSEQADLRSWLTLPAHIQVAEFWVEPGERTVRLGGGKGRAGWEKNVTLTAEKTTLVQVSRMDLTFYPYVVVQP